MTAFVVLLWQNVFVKKRYHVLQTNSSFPSQRSKEWQFISESERNGMGLNFAHDGEFWMSFSDFSKNFQKLEIVHLGPEVSGEKVAWSCNAVDGGWQKRVNAGGCRNFLGLNSMNFKHNRYSTVQCVCLGVQTRSGRILSTASP